MAGATDTGRRLPGDPEIPETVPWFIAAARGDPQAELRATTRPAPAPLHDDVPTRPRFAEVDTSTVDETVIPPPPIASTQTYGRPRRDGRSATWIAGGIVGVAIAGAAGWLARDLVGKDQQPVAVERSVEATPALTVRAVPVAPPTVVDTTPPVSAPPAATQLFPDEIGRPVQPSPPVATRQVPAEFRPAPVDTPRVVAARQQGAAPPVAPPIVRPPPPTTIARIAPAAPRAEPVRREAARPVVARAPIPVEQSRSSERIVGNCDPGAPAGARLVCNDATLKALDSDLNAANASVRSLAAGDADVLQKLARGDAKFAERRDRCTTARCVADKYDDRLSDVEAMQRRLAKGKPVAGLPECKGFQAYRPSAPCTIRGGR